ncbi:enhancer of mRNA-decapping protein 3 [Battus philenor]|uniref:enhancer of mRNA-decapping protein 3 n=1 Tax=Battus philenor TaxID=42288 RepID=UPI0035CFFAC9
MSSWVGYAVSVNCGEPLGCYQGTILQTDGNTITLTKAFRNGFPYPKCRVTLNAADIKELKIIEECRAEPAQQTHSTVAVTKNSKKGPRATVCENLQANPSNVTSAVNNQASTSSAGVAHAPKSGTAARHPTPGSTRSKPIDIQGARNNKNNTHSGSYGAAGTGSTPKGRGGGCGGGGAHEKARRRNEACFGDTAEPALLDDFDFEGNLALFDKQALWQQMRSAARPDVVRAADEAGARLRHDESVLGEAATVAGAVIRVPDELRACEYLTESGLPVPGVTSALRRRLWAGLRGAAAEGARALLARAAADVALRLVGGGRRLESRNAHQAPVCVSLVAPHRIGATGVLAARLFASHGARAYVLLAGDSSAAASCGVLQKELSALALGGGTAVSRAELLPSPDLLLVALHDPEEAHAPELYEEALTWARASRGAVVALEPPEQGWAGLSARAAVLGVLPAALPPALGRVYLANVAPPPRLFRDLHITYRPPFAACSVLPLHPAL